MWVLILTSVIIIVANAVQVIVILSQDSEIDRLYDKLNGGDEE